MRSLKLPSATWKDSLPLTQSGPLVPCCLFPRRYSQPRVQSLLPIRPSSPPLPPSPPAPPAHLHPAPRPHQGGHDPQQVHHGLGEHAAVVAAVQVALGAGDLRVGEGCSRAVGRWGGVMCQGVAL